MVGLYRGGEVTMTVC